MDTGCVCGAYMRTMQPPNDSATGASSPLRLPLASPPSQREGLFKTEGWEGESDVFDWEPFRLLGGSMVEYIADYYQRVEAHPVAAQVDAGYLKV